MKRNVGPGDALVRIVLALLIAGLGIYFTTWWGLLALIPMITAFTGFCPIYKLMGISSCNVNTHQ